MSNLLTRQQVSERCGISRTTIYRLMRAGEFPEPIRIGPRAVRWREDDLVKWLAGRPYSSGDGVHRAHQRGAA